MEIHKIAQQIIEKLNQAGYEAYVVGGCVRDMFLGRTPNDWDICTNATPEQTTEVFEGYNIVNIGIEHGTIAIIIDNEPYEVTTYRVDGDYSDGRRPDEVAFTKSLTEDLARRDFTINAMAYHPEEGLIDPFNGLMYMADELIVCVGDPNKRFQEDGLRIMRAIRFVSQLGFKLDLETSEAIYQNKQLLKKISGERVREELTKTLMSDNAEKGIRLMHGLEIMSVIIPEISQVEISKINVLAIDKLPKKPEIRVAGLVSVLSGKIGSPDKSTAELVQVYSNKVGAQPEDTRGTSGSLTVEELSQLGNILSRLRYSNKEIQSIIQLVQFQHTELIAEKSFILRMLNKLGKDQFMSLIELQKVVRPEQIHEIVEVEKMLKGMDLEKECFEIKHLVITGNDLIETGIKPGKLLGQTLQDILEKVMCGELQNEKEILLAYVKGLKQNISKGTFKVLTHKEGKILSETLETSKLNKEIFTSSGVELKEIIDREGI